MVYNNSIHNWLYAGVITVGVVIAGYMVKKIIQRQLNVPALERLKHWDDIVRELLKHVRIWFLLIVGLYAGSIVLILPENVSIVLNKSFYALLFFQVGLIGSSIIGIGIEGYRQSKIKGNGAAATTLGSVGFLMRVLLWLVLLLVALDNFGVDITTLVAGLGISGIAVALAVQNILGDLFASFSIVFDKPFVIGDFIIVGDYLGNVEYVGLKTTRVRSLSGEQLIFSNTDLTNSRVRNYKRMEKRRVVFSLGVVYSTSYEQMKEIPGIIKGIINNIKDTAFDRAHFFAYGDFSLNIEVVYYVIGADYNKYMDIQQKINLDIMEEFKKRNIEFAYPTQTLFVQKS